MQHAEIGFSSHCLVHFNDTSLLTLSVLEKRLSAEEREVVAMT